VQPRAVFLDLDDTLLDGGEAARGAWEVITSQYAPRLGCEPRSLREAIRRESIAFWKDESKVERQWRTRLRAARAHVIRQTLEVEGLDPSFAWSMANEYGAEHRARLRPFPDAMPVLEAIRSSGRRLALLTNGPQDLQRDKIDRFGLEEFFEVIVIEGEFGFGKPHRNVFQHALETTGVDPVEAWHVGDNLYADVMGAQRAGIHAVWIHRDRLELREDTPAVPDRVVANLSEIPEALETEPGAGQAGGRG